MTDRLVAIFQLLIVAAALFAAAAGMFAFADRASAAGLASEAGHSGGNADAEFQAPAMAGAASFELAGGQKEEHKHHTLADYNIQKE